MVYFNDMLVLIAFRFGVLVTLIMYFKVSTGSKSALRVLFGQDADFENYKFVVRIEVRITQSVNVVGLPILAYQFIDVCSSTFLSPIWILTAGHCLQEYDKVKNQLKKLDPKWLVRYGSPVPWPNSSYSSIVSVKIHPGFKKTEILNGIHMENDIALAKTNPVKLERYGKLSAVDYSSILGKEVITAGYGLMEVGYSTLTLNKMLQVLNVILNKCSKDLTGSMYPSICLSGKCGQVGSICPGDSGGPVIHSSGIVGVNSMVPGINCNLKRYRKRITHNNIVGIVCPVSPYIDWISNAIKNDKVSSD